jgi:hypothetical protein
MAALARVDITSAGAVVLRFSAMPLGGSVTLDEITLRAVERTWSVGLG